MKVQIKSIFNLIEIFRQSKKSKIKPLNTNVHCDEKHHHDFYCDVEKPFISL
jgi:hypothetical protein